MEKARCLTRPFTKRRIPMGGAGFCAGPSAEGPRRTSDNRGKLVAGSFQGKTGHMDGKPSDARRKSNVPGYRDGPSGEVKFSSDFDVIYVQPTCSLLVVDRGNAALRQISLNHEDCSSENSSISSIQFQQENVEGEYIEQPSKGEIRSSC